MFRLLEDVTHEDVQEFAPRRLLLELVGRAVADRRVTENWPRAQLYILIQLLLLLHQVVA